MRRLKEGNEFNNVTLKMITKLYDEGLGHYVNIRHVGPYENEECVLERIEGADYGFDGWAYGYENYENEGYDSEEEALEAYLQDNMVFVFGLDIGQTGCNWMDETSMENYLSDVYIDLDSVERADPEDKKIFRKLGIRDSEEQSKTLVYTVKIKIDTYEDWEDDYDSFDEYVDDVAKDAQKAFDEIAYYHEEGVTVDIEQE